MTNIALHQHADVGWVSWNRGRTGFSAIHLEPRLAGDVYPKLAGHGMTLCGVSVPNIGRVVRNQDTAAIEDICLNCLSVFAKEAR